MTSRQSQTREFLVRGHRLRVFPFDESRWGVAVDGEELHPDCTSAYAAWAVGVAESYRRGLGPELSPPTDRS